MRVRVHVYNTDTKVPQQIQNVNEAVQGKVNNLLETMGSCPLFCSLPEHVTQETRDSRLHWHT